MPFDTGIRPSSFRPSTKVSLVAFTQCSMAQPAPSRTSLNWGLLMYWASGCTCSRLLLPNSASTFAVATTVPLKISDTAAGWPRGGLVGSAGVSGMRGRFDGIVGRKSCFHSNVLPVRASHTCRIVGRSFGSGLSVALTIRWMNAMSTLVSSGFSIWIAAPCPAETALA